MLNLFYKFYQKMPEAFEWNYDDYREENSESKKEEIDAAINHTKSDLDSFQSEMFWSGFNSINEFYRLEWDDLVYQLNKVRNYLASVSQRLQWMKKQKFWEVSKENNFKWTILAIKIALKAMETDSENPKKYDIGKINWEYDETTIQAIKQFQTDNNLMWNDWKPGKETIWKLLEEFGKFIDNKKEKINEQKNLKNDITNIIEDSWRCSMYWWLLDTTKKELMINYIMEWNLWTGKNTNIESEIYDLSQNFMNWKLQYLITHSKEPIKDNIAKIKEDEIKRREILMQSIELWRIENPNYDEKLNILNKDEKFKNTEYDNLIVQFSKKYSENEKVDPALIKILMYKESRFNPKAHSGAGAKWLMQLMPDTARNLWIKNVYDPKQNIEWGIKLISQLLNKYKWNISLALAAYNAGPWNVKKYGNKIPPFKETRNYVKFIMDEYNKLNA